MNWRRRLVPAAWIVLAATVALHEILKPALADTNVVGTLLASGGGAAAGTLALALLFVVSRLVSVLILPGLLAYGLWTWAATRWAGRGRT